jgi:diguanylate cyclase (GGDEF)-like protein
MTSQGDRGFWGKKSIRGIIYRPALALLILFGIVFIIVTNITMKKMAYQEAFQLSQVLASQNLAIHNFVNQEQKPSFFRVTSLEKDEFLPEMMSSTYMIRRINTYLDPYIPISYYYKEVAVSARSPQNEAQNYEINMLQRFNLEEITEFDEVRTIGREKYFIYMRAGEVMEEDCLQCHGVPADAPAQMVEHYGSERSFNRQPGELISALSIRIPLQEAYAGANRTSAYLTLAYLAMMLLVSGSISSIMSRTVINPVAKLDSRVRDTLGRFNGEAKHVVLDGDEIENVNTVFTFLEEKLTEAYNNLEQHAQGLEEKVSQRTKELEEMNDQLKLASQNDWLLGIFNRGTFEERAKAEYARMRREQGSISFLMVDLDNFKQYNDTYGHQAGDIALKKVSDVIATQVRSYDLLGRYGGEELSVCLPGATRDEAIQVASRIVDAVYAAHIYHSGNPPYGVATVSVGMASVENAQTSHYEKLLNEADDNMYAAKNSTRNTYFPKE